MTDPTLVQTANGAVRGRRLPGGGLVFARIPFAAPPVGELRWRPPQPPVPWTGVRETGFMAAPAQRAPALMKGMSTSAFGQGFQGASIGETSEDCLYLNVWTHDDGESRPAIVWIYGGGFDSGSAAPPTTDGAALARLTGAVVVATNYRVGALGFLHLSDLGGSGWAGSSNLGLQDQAVALSWVRDNVAAFGGDPTRITVAGESAGAFSIGALLALPQAAGTFGKAILSSGSTGRIFDAATATAVATDLISALELDDIEGLRYVPTERLLDIQNLVIDRDIGDRNLPGGRSWGVVLDGTVLPRDPQQAVAAGVAADIPLLIGANRDEVRVFQVAGGDAFRPPNEHALCEELRRAGAADPQAALDAYRKRIGDGDLAVLRGAILTDAVYRRPATRLAAAQVAAGGRAHSYLFCEEPAGPVLGCFHGADLLYLFDRLGSINADTTERLAVRDALTTAWGTFAATGDPGWPTYEPGATATTRAFGCDDAMITEPPTEGTAIS